MQCDALLKRVANLPSGCIHARRQRRRVNGPLVLNHGSGQLRTISAGRQASSKAHDAFRTPIHKHAATVRTIRRVLFGGQHAPTDDARISEHKSGEAPAVVEQTLPEPGQSRRGATIVEGSVPQNSANARGTSRAPVRKHATIVTRSRRPRSPRPNTDEGEDSAHKQRVRGAPAVLERMLQEEQRRSQPDATLMQSWVWTSEDHKSKGSSGMPDHADARKQEPTTATRVRQIPAKEIPSLRFFHASNKTFQRRLERQSRRWQKPYDPSQDLKSFRKILQLLDDNTPGSATLGLGSSSDILMEDDSAFALDQLEQAIDDLTYAPNSSTPNIRLTLGREAFCRRPPVFTDLSFTAYVEELARTRSLRHVSNLECSEHEGSRHSSDPVSDELVSLFTDPHLKHCIRSDALDVCLQYLTRHKKFYHIRRISDHLEHGDYKLTTSNLDALLAAAACEQSVGVFVYWLRHMARTGIAPTARTWIAVHRLAADKLPGEVGDVEACMQERGLFESPTILSRIALHVISVDLAATIANGKELQSFLCDYDIRYGRDRVWLTRSAINSIVSLLLEHGKMEDAVKLSHNQADNNMRGGDRAATRTADVFLAAAMRKQDMAAAVTSLRSLTWINSEHTWPIQRIHQSSSSAVGSDHTMSPPLSPGTVEPNLGPLTFGILFQLAWKTSHFNCLRVIWRYACAAGQVTNAMRARMHSGLSMSGPRPELDKETAAVVDAHLGKPGNLPKPAFKKAEWALRVHLWSFSAPRFALCLHRDLDPAATDPHTWTLIRSGLLERTSKASIHSLEHQQRELQHGILGLKSSRTLPANLVPTKKLWESLLRRDITRGPDYRPPKPFVEMLERAWKMDCEWKETGLSLAKGVLEPQNFERMLEPGIEVAMLANTTSAQVYNTFDGQ